MLDYKLTEDGYVLTLDGIKIGEVYEKDHIETLVHNAHNIPKLEREIEALKKNESTHAIEVKRLEQEIHNLKHQVEAYRMTLQKIAGLASITQLAKAPDVKPVHINTNQLITKDETQRR